MPSTAQQYGLKNPYLPEENIKAGTKHLAWINKYWEPIITDETERLKFTVASYNAGIGHILDARRLAEKYGKDPNIWNENVDYYIKNKSKSKYYKDSVVRHGYCRGYETYNYVNIIFSTYEQYKNVVAAHQQELASL